MLPTLSASATSASSYTARIDLAPVLVPGRALTA